MNISKKAKQHPHAIAILFLLILDETEMNLVFADASNHFLRSDKRKLGANKEYVCHMDQNTGWRKTLSVAEHALMAHTEKHNDKIGKCSVVRQDIINDYISSNCSTSSSSTSNLLCTEITINGLELTNDEELSPFEGCSEQVKTLNAMIELDFTFGPAAKGSSEDGRETLLQDNCESDSPCWPYLCDLRNKHVTLRLQATDLKCNEERALSRCDHGRISLGGSLRDVSLRETTWNACIRNKVLEPFPDYGLDYFKQMIEPPVDDDHADKWCISIKESNLWYHEGYNEGVGNPGCLESEGYPKFFKWSEVLEFSVPFSVTVVVGGGTVPPVATNFGPYTSRLTFASTYHDQGAIPSFASPTNFYHNNFFFNCTLEDPPHFCKAMKNWQARLLADEVYDPECFNLIENGSWYSSFILPYKLNSMKISKLGE